MVQKSGAIVKQGNHILLLYRAKEQDWTFPKGHIEPGEDAAQAMVRELKEETGLDVRIVKPLPDHSYLSPFEGDVVTQMFLAEPTEPQQEVRTERDGDDLRWIPRDHVTKTLSYENLQTYFQKQINEQSL